MKNVKPNQLKRCIFLTLDEFERLLDSLGFGVDAGYDGLSFYVKDDEDEDLYDEDVYYVLSEYFDVDITSIHCDDYDYVGIWIVFR